jgi:hypothetical protein
MKQITLTIVLIFAFAMLCRADSIPLPDSTQATFDKMYNDVKGGIEGLASALQTGTTHVYGVLVRQQVVKAVAWLLVMILFGSFIVFYIRKMAKVYNSPKWEEKDSLFAMAGGVVSSVGILIFLFKMNIVITGLANPQYGAIREIINFVKD